MSTNAGGVSASNDGLGLEPEPEDPPTDWYPCMTQKHYDIALRRAVATERGRWRQAVEPVLSASEDELPHLLYLLAGLVRA